MYMYEVQICSYTSVNFHKNFGFVRHWTCELMQKVVLELKPVFTLTDEKNIRIESNIFFRNQY